MPSPTARPNACAFSLSAPSVAAASLEAGLDLEEPFAQQRATHLRQQLAEIPALLDRAETLIAHMALTPDVVYVIVSLRNADAPVVKGFLINDHTITAVPVEVMSA